MALRWEHRRMRSALGPMPAPLYPAAPVFAYSRCAPASRRRTPARLGRGPNRASRTNGRAAARRARRRRPPRIETATPIRVGSRVHYGGLGGNDFTVKALSADGSTAKLFYDVRGARIGRRRASPPPPEDPAALGRRRRYRRHTVWRRHRRQPQAALAARRPRVLAARQMDRSAWEIEIDNETNRSQVRRCIISLQTILEHTVVFPILLIQICIRRAGACCNVVEGAALLLSDLGVACAILSSAWFLGELAKPRSATARSVSLCAPPFASWNWPSLPSVSRPVSFLWNLRSQTQCAPPPATSSPPPHATV